MSFNDCYIALIQLWLAEDVRLADNVAEYQRRICKNYCADDVIGYIEACVKRQYFKEYIWEVLKWLKPYASGSNIFD